MREEPAGRTMQPFFFEPWFAGQNSVVREVKKEVSLQRIFAIVVCVALLAASAPLVFDRMMPGTGGAPMFRDREAKELALEQFPEMTARVLKRIEERRTKLDQEKACVEVSRTAEELRKCRPEPPRNPWDGADRASSSAD